MNLYKLKHKSTGLYYQPHKFRGSNLSERGKVYQTKTHGLSSAFKYAELYKTDDRYQEFKVYCAKNSTIYKKTKEILNWENDRVYSSQLKATTKLEDWVIEEIKN
jgi:hypothetical protein